MTTLNEKRFNLAFNIFLVAGMLLALVLTTVFKLRGTEANAFLLVLAAFGSFMGILNSVMSANGNILTFVFGFIDVLIGTIIYLHNGIIGNFALHALYFIPMQFVGFWQWRRRGASLRSADGDGPHLKARRLTPRQWAWLIAGTALGIALLYLILFLVDKSQVASGRLEAIDKSKIMLDAVVMTLNIAGQVLMSLAFTEQWFVWVMVNISSISLWSVAFLSDTSSGNALVMLVKYSFYLLNSLNGLRIWLNLSKKQI